MILDCYDLETYMRPYWQGEVMFHESVMPLENEAGSVSEIPLLLEARRILSVRSSDLKTKYREEVDYKYLSGKLCIPESSKIRTVKHSFYYPGEKTQNCMSLNEAYGKGNIFFSEGDAMHSLQISVSYVHSGSALFEIPPCKRERLKRIHALLDKNNGITVSLLGDSISTGANSTGFVSSPPFAAPWFQMVVDLLKKRYPECPVAFFNHSVGGKTSAWGREMAEKVGEDNPDLCIIGFGMNDGTHRVSPEDFRFNVESIVNTVLRKKRECEFLLIAPILPNPEVGHYFGNQETYLPELLKLEGEGIAVADLTSFHRKLLSRKRYFDMSGNNVNHPNDFLARAYAQVVWQTVIGY